MKAILNLVLIIVLLSVISCGKKATNESSGDNKTVGKIDTVEYKSEKMHCSGCEETITGELKKIDGVKEIKADSKEKYVKVTYDNGKTNKEDIAKAITSVGYDAVLQTSQINNSSDTTKQKEKN
ncbi:MAG: heavy-metal-associated domain-containing protein [Candidatus Kapaibacterium sp.]